MDVLIGAKGTGKTEALIQAAMEREAIIVTASQQEADMLSNTIKARGVEVPSDNSEFDSLESPKCLRPCSIEYVLTHNASFRRRDVMIDDAPRVLEWLIKNRCRVDLCMVTVDSQEAEILSELLGNEDTHESLRKLPPIDSPATLKEAPSVSLEGIHDKVKCVEFVKYRTNGGQTLRWCVLTMENGFGITGDPSCCVSPANDNKAEGQSIALKNALDKVWMLEGYLLKDKLHSDSLKVSVKCDLP